MEKDFKAFAAQKLAEIYGLNDYERVLRALKEADLAFADVVPVRFGMEFLAARLALAAHGWSRACKENQVKDPGAENLFFKAVMQSFQSQKFVEVAASFSEYLHAPGAAEKPILSLSALMMQRLGITDAIVKDKGIVLPPGFKLLIEVSEAFKSAFENDFFEFTDVV